MSGLLLTFAALAAPLVAAGRVSDAPGAPLLPFWDDAAPPLQPLHPRDAQQQDQLAARALFAHGRLLYQQGDYPRALQRFQRAWRCDPDGAAILAEIVPLAFRLNRHAEAARYAVIAAEKNPNSPLLLERLAGYLVSQEDFPRALSLYEKAMLLRAHEPPTIDALVSRLEMGRLYLLTGQFKKSADSFASVRNLLEQPGGLSPEDEAVKRVLRDPDRTYSLLAEGFFQAGRLDEAKAMFEKANQAKPNAGLLAWRLARIEDARGDAQAALEHLETCFRVKLSSAGAGPYRLLAKLLGQLNKNQGEARKQLIQRLEACRRSDPSNAALGYYLAGQLRQSELPDRAEQIYVELLKSAPAPEGYAGMAAILRRRQDVDRLLELLGQLAGQASLLQPSGGVFEELASDPQWPRRLIDRARQRRKDPSRPLGDGVPLAVALVAAEAKDFSAADEFIELALQARAPSKAQVMIAWGLEMMLVGQYERAAKILERAIAESGMPDKAPMLHLQRASALEQAGKLDEALGEAKKAVALSPGSSRVRCGMALILYRAKRYDDAEKENLQLLKQFDSNYESSETRDDMLQARMMLSNICVEQKRLAEAEEWLEQVLDEHPEHIGALNDLGYLWADQGKRLHRAVEMVRQAVQGEPDNAAYRDSLGWAYYRLGRYEEAVKELEKAAAGEKPDGIILDHLGDAHWKMNHPEQAVAAWRKALEALASDQEKSSAIKIKIEKHKTKQPDRT